VSGGGLRRGRAARRLLTALLERLAEGDDVVP
jgi:hypothetical protein